MISVLNAGVSRNTVLRVKKLKKDGESLKPKFKGGATKKKRTEDFLRLIKERFEEDPYAKMNKVAKEMDVAPSTITASFKDLGLKSFVQVSYSSILVSCYQCNTLAEGNLDSDGGSM